MTAVVGSTGQIDNLVNQSAFGDSAQFVPRRVQTTHQAPMWHFRPKELERLMYQARSQGSGNVTDTVGENYGCTPI